jgi:hypothetical protein
MRLFSAACFGGRTRTRTLDPLIKSHKLSLQKQLVSCKSCRNGVLDFNGLQVNCKLQERRQAGSRLAGSAISTGMAELKGRRGTLTRIS